MKINKVYIILVITMLIILLSNVKSYAAVAITKDGAVFTNKTISDFFDMCREMNKQGQGLEGSDVNVHMSTNREWATVSYFSNSNYGTATEGRNTGVAVNIDGQEFLSTNGNATGVMDWGKTYSFTSSVISNYSDVDARTTIYENGKSLIDNIGGSNVDLFKNDVNIRDIQAINGWYQTWTHINSRPEYPYSIRSGLFGFFGGDFGASAYIPGEIFHCTKGSANNYITFRPVILN